MKVKREWYDAIKFRHSRRTYEKKIISKGNRLKIIQLIDDINAESGLNLQFIEDGEQFLTGFKASYGMITGTNYLIALVGNRNLKNLKRLIGYYGELLVLECTSLGLGTCWIGGTYDKSECIKYLNLPEEEDLICVISLGHVPNDKSLKEKVLSKLSKNVKAFDDILIEKDSTIPRWVRCGINSALLAPSALNKKPVAYSYINGTLKAFTTKSNKGYEDIDLGISMAHFMLGATSTGYDGKWSDINGENIFIK